jgi:hypothetical protein
VAGVCVFAWAWWCCIVPIQQKNLTAIFLFDVFCTRLLLAIRRAWRFLPGHMGRITAGRYSARRGAGTSGLHIRVKRRQSRQRFIKAEVGVYSRPTTLMGRGMVGVGRGV